MRSPRIVPPPHSFDLVERCRQGDRTAQEQVLRVESPAILSLLKRILGARPEVEDVFQCTLLGAIQAFPSFRGEASVKHWLTAIAVRKAYDHLRRQRTSPPLALVSREAEWSDPRSLERMLESRCALERLYQHLQRLKPKSRVAYMLYVFEGYSIEEVAALVGASPVVVKARVFMGRRTLLAHARRDPGLALWCARGGRS